MHELLWRAWAKWRMARRVRKYGWQPMGVGDYGDPPAWIYTVGLPEHLGGPELVVFDAPWEQGVAVLYEAVEEIRAGKLVLQDGLAWPDEEQDEEGPGVPPVWRRVHPDRIREGWFAFATWHHRMRTRSNDPIEVYQLVLCDPQGRLPWDEGYPEACLRTQPQLWLPPSDATGRYPWRPEA